MKRALLSYELSYVHPHAPTRSLVSAHIITSLSPQRALRHSQFNQRGDYFTCYTKSNMKLQIAMQIAIEPQKSIHIGYHSLYTYAVCVVSFNMILFQMSVRHFWSQNMSGTVNVRRINR
jgi:hypothetical protein